MVWRGCRRYLQVRVHLRVHGGSHAITRKGSTYHVLGWFVGYHQRVDHVTILSRIIFSNEEGGPFMPLFYAPFCHATTPANQPRLLF